MDFIIEHWKDITLIVTGLVTVASTIVKLTPSKKDDIALMRVLKIVSLARRDK